MLIFITQMALLLSFPADAAGGRVMTLKIESPTFGEGATIPKKYTCDGPDISPALTWSGIPEGTKSLALICDDPDAPAGTWVHWVLYDLPVTTGQLSEWVPRERELKGGGRQGTNDFGKIGYGGPCPPRGPAHRYYFKLYALDRSLNLSPGATKEDVLKAAKGHVIGEASLMGRYGR